MEFGLYLKRLLKSSLSVFTTMANLALYFRAVFTTAFQHVVSEDLQMDFLLIFRTHRIVTISGIEGYTGVPAYSWIC